jgi:hypothetical protein
MRDYDYNEPILDQPSTMNVYGEKEYIRPRMDYLRENEISIRFLSLGCLVRVGCKEIAFTSIEEAMEEFNAYVANPKRTTDRYNKLFNEQK